MEGQEVKSAVAVIDNGKYGKREIRFETGRLAKQAAGSALVYLDDQSMLLSATVSILPLAGSYASTLAKILARICGPKLVVLCVI